MQEQQGTPVARGGLRVLAGFIILVVLLWLLIWLLFFRNASPKPSNSHKTATKQNGGQTVGGGTVTYPSPSSSTPTAAQSGQLVNAGAGNVLVPTAVAGLAGGVLYQVRLRKKLNSSHS